MAISLGQFRKATEGLDDSTMLFTEPTPESNGQVRTVWLQPACHKQPQLPEPPKPDGTFDLLLSDHSDLPVHNLFVEVRDDHGLVKLIGDPPSDEEILHYAAHLGERAAAIDAKHGRDSEQAAEHAAGFARLRERNPAVADSGFLKGYRAHFAGYIARVRQAAASLDEEIPF